MRTTLNKNKVDIYEGAAKKLEEDVKLVSQIGDYIFDDLKNKMVEFDGYCFYMYKLGSFKIRAGEAEKHLRQVNVARNLAKNLSEEDAKVLLEGVDRKSKKLRNLLDRYYELMDKKKALKQQLKDGQINRDIQEQKEDLGGDEKQPL